MNRIEKHAARLVGGQMNWDLDKYESWIEESATAFAGRLFAGRFDPLVLSYMQREICKCSVLGAVEWKNSCLNPYCGAIEIRRLTGYRFETEFIESEIIKIVEKNRTDFDPCKAVVAHRGTREVALWSSGPAWFDEFLFDESPELVDVGIPDGIHGEPVGMRIERT